MAAGLTIDKSKIEALRERFNAVVKEKLGVEDLIPIRRVDLVISLDQVDDALETLLGYVEPCGIGNPKPVLAVEQAAAREVRELKGKHLKMVVDDGSGIRADRLDRIFDPFYTTRREAGSPGLGLAVVHGIVTGHRGRVDVVSVEGEGTRFTVTLPAPKDEAFPEL